MGVSVGCWVCHMTSVRERARVSYCTRQTSHVTYSASRVNKGNTFSLLLLLLLPKFIAAAVDDDDDCDDAHYDYDDGGGDGDARHFNDNTWHTPNGAINHHFHFHR